MVGNSVGNKLLQNIDLYNYVKIIYGIILNIVEI